MSECPNCKAPCSAQDRYCNQCGTRLTKVELAESGARTQKAVDLVDVYYNLGMVYFKQGQYPKALEIWERTLARDPHNGILQERIAEVQTLIRAGGDRPALGSTGKTP